MIILRVSTRPALRIRYSSSEYSVIVHELTGIHLSLYSPDLSQTRTRFPFSHQSPLCLLIGASERGMAE